MAPPCSKVFGIPPSEYSEKNVLAVRCVKSIPPLQGHFGIGANGVCSGVLKVNRPCFRRLHNALVSVPGPAPKCPIFLRDFPVFSPCFYNSPLHQHLQELQSVSPLNCPEFIAEGEIPQRAQVSESPENRPTQVSRPSGPPERPGPPCWPTG